jgi:hypothetical protein
MLLVYCVTATNSRFIGRRDRSRSRSREPPPHHQHGGRGSVKPRREAIRMDTYIPDSSSSAPTRDTSQVSRPPLPRLPEARGLPPKPITTLPALSMQPLLSSGTSERSSRFDRAGEPARPNVSPVLATRPMIMRLLPQDDSPEDDPFLPDELRQPAEHTQASRGSQISADSQSASDLYPSRDQSPGPVAPRDSVTRDSYSEVFMRHGYPSRPPTPLSDHGRSEIQLVNHDADDRLHSSRNRAADRDIPPELERSYRRPRSPRSESYSSQVTTQHLEDSHGAQSDLPTQSRTYPSPRHHHILVPASNRLCTVFLPSILPLSFLRVLLAHHTYTHHSPSRFQSCTSAFAIPRIQF